MSTLGPLRPVRVKACKRAAETAVDTALDAGVGGKVTSERKRRDLLRAVANAGIIVCEQSSNGVPWTRDAVQVFSIPSESMLPTIKVGDRVLLNKIAYKVEKPKRGDIVVHDLPARYRPRSSPPASTGSSAFPARRSRDATVASGSTAGPSPSRICRSGSSPARSDRS
jgi:hypothetical protein